MTKPEVTDGRLKLLMVDDDDLIIQSIRMSLPSNWRLRAANSLSEVPKEVFNAAFVDMHLTPGKNNKPEGLEVIRELDLRDPHLEIVAISGDLDRDLMEACLKAGASRFLAKPLSPEEFTLTLDKIEALLLLKMAAARGGADQIQWLGESQESQKVQRQIAELRGEPGPILIDGESGTGKEVVAHLLNKQEISRPFISVNVAALPENVFESEVFGHVRGAFTGADQNKMGLAEAAHNGDLFLDEIEALPLSQQAKLLRFLESGEVRRVGAKESIHVNARVIVATNQNLSDLVKEGKFREDLLWRLNGKKILLPPLRSRRDDVAVLAENFLAQQRPRRNKKFSPEALETLKTYHFPGNVRELKRLCEQVALLAPLPIIRKEDITTYMPVFLPSSAQSGSLTQTDLSEGLTVLLEKYEAELIRRGLDARSEIDQVAQLLKISRSSLYKKIKDYNIEIGGS
jgi:DNA-binding NtrC family response regulator